MRRQLFVGLRSSGCSRGTGLVVYYFGGLGVAGQMTVSPAESLEILRKSAIFMLDRLKVYRLVCAVA